MSLNAPSPGGLMADTPRLIRFILVGGSTPAIHISLTWLLVETLDWNVTLASTIALLVSAIYNYSMHYYWTFSSDAPHGWVLVKYLLMCLGALIINALVMHFGVQVFPVHYLFVQIPANIMVATWSFSVSSLWVFKK